MQSFLPVPYFASERSFAQYRLPEEARSTVGFGQSANTIVVVTASGAYYSATFDPQKGGACDQQEFCIFAETDAGAS